MNIGIIGFGFVGKTIYWGFQTKLPQTQFILYDIQKPDPKNIIQKNTSVESLEFLVKNSDYIFICVPTPTNFNTGQCDITIVANIVHRINEYMTPYQRGCTPIIIKSTIAPGTTQSLQEKVSNMCLVFNPEFLTEKNYIADFINQDRIIIGSENQFICSLMKDLYKNGWPDTPILTISSIEAEMVKYVSNAFLSTKIAFFNEMYEACKIFDAQYEKVRLGVSLDKRIGPSHSNVPGPDGEMGFGGTCLPKDLKALTYIIDACGGKTDILKAVWAVNERVRTNKDWLKIDGAHT